jgi:type II secretory ATPase GspE/PulE/Tfp pilus assembly ATPase PilB-like protein
MKDILVGDISKEKEKEFIDAIEMDKTGHLIFTTIAQHNAVEAYKRLIKLGIKK